MTAQGEDILAWLDHAIREREDAARCVGWDSIQSSEYMWGTKYLTLYRPGESKNTVEMDSDLADHITLHDPESVLRRCAADRKLMTLHQPVVCGAFGCDCDRKCKTCDWTASQEFDRKPAWGQVDHHIFPCPTVRALAESYGWAAEQNPPIEGDRVT
ncbi:DUF6221 family protein [Streptomyces rochei]|uniref:DUF6221 family protein n=1 Tax=Streptomyces rochei TaxID=1928 RepID=UPI0040632E93